MGMFSAVSGASVNGGGVYFKAGNYEVSLLAVKAVLSRKNENLFVIETEILKSDVESLRPGTKVSQVINLSKHESAPGNIKGFLCAALDAPEDEVGEAEAELVTSELNPLAGTKMGLVCTTILTKAKTDFTLHQWRFIRAPEHAVSQAARAPAAPAAPKLLPGYQLHPTAAGFQWNPQTNHVVAV